MAKAERGAIPIPHAVFTELGPLPIRKGVIRFAVGPPDGLTSNGWRVWATASGDVYLACRDNMKETKVSLHASGRWRMAFTSEAIARQPELLREGQRTWEVWDKPPERLPNTVIAFRLLFATSELAVRPDQRKTKEWRGVVHVEAAPPGKVTVATLFITNGDFDLRHETEPYFTLASLDIGHGRRAQVVMHNDPELNLPTLIDQSVSAALRGIQDKGLVAPPESYLYAFGKHHEDGARFIFGARLFRSGVA